MNHLSLSTPVARTAVYVGPSLAGAPLPPLPGVEWRPPIRRGDLPQALREGRFREIVILDGEFGQSLAVSVAEIREALVKGLTVVGAASMGALRAVDCQRLGMHGVGWVFERFRAGALTSDDEVALLFDPWTWEPQTIPLVNLRWTTELAVERGIVDASEGPDVVAILGAINYRERSMGEMHAATRRAGAEPAAKVLQLLESEPLACDRKRLDAQRALALLDTPSRRDADDANA